MQTGAFGFGQANNPNEWQLHRGTGERRFHTTIKFGAPFNTVPQLAVALVDSSNTANLRVWIAAEDIQTDEFDLVVNTWDDTLIYAVWGVWIAQ